MSRDSDYVKDQIKRSLRLTRVSNTHANKAASDLSKLHGRIINKIKQEYPNITSKGLSKLNKDVVKLIVEDYDDGIVQSLDDVVTELASNEASWINESLRIYSDNVSSAVVNSKAIATAASKKTFQGHTFDFWFKTSGKRTHKRVMSIIQTGYIDGVSTEQVVTEVGKILSKNKRDVKTLVRSYMNHAGIEARTQQADANSDLVEEYIWLSVLDVRTTATICGIRDKKRYNKDKQPIGHSLAWGSGPGRIHFNCRSSFIIKPLGSGDILRFVKRPSVAPGAEYESGLNKTNRGTVRKPTKRNREKGIYKIQSVSGDVGYDDWLRTKKIAFIEDAIGNKNLAKKFKSGEFSLLDVARQSGDLNVLEL